MEDDCKRCVHYNEEDNGKLFGHPCRLHDKADSFLCSDFRTKYDPTWKRDANALGRHFNWRG